DGIRDFHVTGVQTCALPISERVGSMGLDRAYSATEQLAALALKTLSQTFIRELWLLAHSVLRRHWDGPINIRVDGRWQETFPARSEERRVGQEGSLQE